MNPIPWPYNIVAATVGGLLLVLAAVGATAIACAVAEDPIAYLDDPDEEERHG